MSLTEIGGFIENNGLAVLIIVAIGYTLYKILAPYFSKKLNKSVEKEGKLEGKVNDRYFKLIDVTIKDAKESNEKLMVQLTDINETNKRICDTNNKLVENFEARICKVECVSEGISEVVNKINCKIDRIIEK